MVAISEFGGAPDSPDLLFQCLMKEIGGFETRRQKMIHEKFGQGLIRSLEPTHLDLCGLLIAFPLDSGGELLHLLHLLQLHFLHLLY
jgi:hypothetical protein